MLGADVLVRQALGLLGGIGQHALALVAERQIDAGRNLLADGRVTLDLLANGVHRRMLPEKAIGQCFVLAQQSQQQVLRLDVRRTKLAGLVAGEENHASRFFGVPFKHFASPKALEPATPAPGEPGGNRRLTFPREVNRAGGKALIPHLETYYFSSSFQPPSNPVFIPPSSSQRISLSLSPAAGGSGCCLQVTPATTLVRLPRCARHAAAAPDGTAGRRRGCESLSGRSAGIRHAAGRSGQRPRPPCARQGRQ